MSRSYTHNETRDLFDLAIHRAKESLWRKIQRGNTAERLKLLSVLDAMNEARTAINITLDGDIEHE